MSVNDIFDLSQPPATPCGGEIIDSRFRSRYRPFESRHLKRSVEGGRVCPRRKINRTSQEVVVARTLTRKRRVTLITGGRRTPEDEAAGLFKMVEAGSMSAAEVYDLIGRGLDRSPGARRHGRGVSRSLGQDRRDDCVPGTGGRGVSKDLDRY